MAVTYTDTQIGMLLAERKLLPTNWLAQFQRHPKRGHDERAIVVTGADGNEFHLLLRKSLLNPLDFSIILGVRVPQSNRIFRLRRHNGKSHEHTNTIEKQQGRDGQTFYDFHIHFATQRYQELGNREPKEEAYAEVTSRYSDSQEALECLIADAGFETDGLERPMFPIVPEV